jgi:hypothetical protein
LFLLCFPLALLYVVSSLLSRLLVTWPDAESLYSSTILLQVWSFNEIAEFLHTPFTFFFIFLCIPMFFSVISTSSSPEILSFTCSSLMEWCSTAVFDLSSFLFPEFPFF